MARDLPPLRQYARICIPGVVLQRAISAVTRAISTALSLQLLAGPELAKRLERRVARLDGISCPSRLQRWQLGAARWLLEAPETEPEPTEDDDLLHASSRAALAASLGLLRGKRTPFSAGQQGGEEHLPSFDQATAQEPLASPDHTTRGAC